MTRAERAAEAVRLKAEGLNGIQIAERMGISRAYAYGLLNDPTGDGDRQRKKQYAGECIDCGGPTDGSNGRGNAPKRCAHCEQHQNDERNAQIIEAWEQGQTGEQIAARLGLTYNQVRGVVEHAQRKGVTDIRHKRSHRELWPLIERRWHEGATQREIAAEAGTTWENIAFMVQVMRKRGIDLPYRLPRRKAAA